MAKKAKNENAKKEFNADEIQAKMDKYYKAQESEKKGKALAGSIIGFSVLCFLILLIVILKMSGVGKTVVFTTDESGKVDTEIVETTDVEATRLADILTIPIDNSDETNETVENNG